MKSIRNSKGLYWGLIITFFILYFLVGFVSTLHSITFFQLANVTWMAVLLGITYEVGQAAVLFSILMSDNSKKILPWLLMFLLTALQITANVYASFKFMDGSGSMDWTFWQRSILFWLEADGPEMFKVVISWITGALLPVVALGMTALVAENLKLKDEQEEKKEDEIEDEELPWEKEKRTEEDINKLKDIASEVHRKNDEDKIKDIEEKLDKRTAQLEALKEELLKNQEKWPVTVPEELIPDKPSTSDTKDIKETPMLKLGDKVKKTPENHPRGWHLKKEFIDDNGDVYKYGRYIPDEHAEPPPEEQTDPPKKA